jgi:type IV secretory pathway VirD2 relaxase
MTDLRAFARELVADMERDLGTKLDWIAVDHYRQSALASSDPRQGRGRPRFGE